MKKRWIGLLLAVLLAVTPALLSGALAESALFQKMQKQLNAGSGLKGTVTVSGVQGLEGVSLDVKYILAKLQSQLLLSLESGGKEVTKAALYQQEGSFALDAGLSSGKLYGLSGGLDSIPVLLSGQAGGVQTSFLSTLAGILTESDKDKSASLAEAAAPYLTKTDLWMQGFAASPVQEKTDNGTSVMKMSYTIPAAALKAEMKQLMLDLLADKKLLPLLWGMMSSDQANLYLNPALQSFYFQAIDTLPLNGDITMMRRLSTAGDLLETSLSLPINVSDKGEGSLSFSSKAADGGDLIDIKLELGKSTLEFTAQNTSPAQVTESEQPENISYTGILRYLPAELPNYQVDAASPQYDGKAISVSYQASYTMVKSVDADGKNNENNSVTVSLTPDWSHLTQVVTDQIKAQYALTDPVQITASLVVKSGQARNAATSLEALVRYLSGATDVTVSGQFKTTPPWSFDQVDIAAAEKLDQMTGEQRSALLMEFIGKPGFAELFGKLLPSEASGL